jgi:nicotinate-nucleotide pyrophosphorylase (carboxylating)
VPGERADRRRDGAGRADADGGTDGLNFLRHLSAWPVTRWCVEAGGGTLRIADTRKTLPLLRALQKYAVRVGGGTSTRQSLDEGIVIKANHARAGGGLAASVARVRAAKPEAAIHAEAATLEEAGEAVDAGAAVIVFTGASLPELEQLLRRCAGRARVIVSGQFRSSVSRRLRRPAQTSWRSGPSPIRPQRRT